MVSMADVRVSDYTRDSAHDIFTCTIPSECLLVNHFFTLFTIFVGPIRLFSVSIRSNVCVTFLLQNESNLRVTIF